MVAGYHMSGWGALQGRLLPEHRPWATSAAQNAIGRVELYLFSGHAALMVFFVISGFVLRVSLQYGPQDFAGAAVRFHVARFFRIYPIVIVGVLAAAFTYTFHGAAPSPPLAASILFANMALLSVSLNNTLWAIQLEVVMAPLIVGLYFLERWRGPRALIAVAVVTTLLAFGNWAIWRPLSEYFFAFAIGMLLPTVGRNWATRLTRAASRWWLVAAVLGLLLPWPVLGFYSKFSAIIEGYSAAALVAIAAYRVDAASLACLDWRPVRLLGLASGSFYVLHMAVLPWIYPLVAGLIPPWLDAQLPALAGPLAIVATLALYAPVAVLSYYLIEAPGIALGRRVIRARPLAAAPAV
jgi:peptidoglycan/LPS O-acetylase OafA/YrhL